MLSKRLTFETHISEQNGLINYSKPSIVVPTVFPNHDKYRPYSEASEARLMELRSTKRMVKKSIQMGEVGFRFFNFYFCLLSEKHHKQFFETCDETF